MIEYTIPGLKKITKPIEMWKHRQAVCACGAEYLQRAPMQSRCAECARLKRFQNQQKSRAKAKERRSA